MSRLQGNTHSMPFKKEGIEREKKELVQIETEKDRVEEQREVEKDRLNLQRKGELSIKKIE